MTTRTITVIDKEINAVRKLLLTRQPVKDRLDASQWQAAWDAEPDLWARDRALWLERGEVQRIHMREAYKTAKKRLERAT